MTNKSIRDNARSYVPKSAKNITELKSVPIDLLMLEEQGLDSEGQEFSYNYVEVQGEKYRVPDSVLQQLKAVLEKKPTLQNFAVSKAGEGKKTRYTVIPLD